MSFDWTERVPESLGVAGAGLDRAVELVAARGVTAQLCVLRDGQVLLDRTFGCGPDALFWIFSASKPYIALLVHLLAERGQLQLDDPVAAYWPEFGRRGKAGITIRQVLQHRAGLPVARSVLADGLAMTSWRRSIRNLERARPSSAPADGPAYHLLTYGFILGQVVGRATGTGVADLLRTEVLQPLGLTDTYLGLPAGSRGVPVRVAGRGGRLQQVAFNRRATRRAVIPAAGISTTARDLARFYQTLLDAVLDDGAARTDPGTGDGARNLTSGTRGSVFGRDLVDQARRPSTDGVQLDRFLGSPVRWSEGFQLGGPGTDPNRPRAMGGLSSPLTFGHNGSKCCIGWADPTRRLVFAYLTDLLPSGRGRRRSAGGSQSAVADAILGACA